MLQTTTCSGSWIHYCCSFERKKRCPYTAVSSAGTHFTVALKSPVLSPNSEPCSSRDTHCLLSCFLGHGNLDRQNVFRAISVLIWGAALSCYSLEYMTGCLSMALSPMTLKLEWVSPSIWRACLKTQAAGSQPPSFWLNKSGGLRIWMSNKCLEMLGGPLQESSERAWVLLPPGKHCSIASEERHCCLEGFWFALCLFPLPSPICIKSRFRNFFKKNIRAQWRM